MHARRSFTTGLLALAAAPAFAQEAYRAGQHYAEIVPPVRTADPSRIEVVEVFAYSCPHCFNFEPLLSAWARRQPADVALVQTHAMWNPAMEPLMRGYYTALALNLKERSHLPTFQALHQQGRRLNGAQEWADFLSGFGVPRERVLATYQSFGVSSQIKQAEQRAREYKVTGTPEMIVNGKYRVSSRSGGGHEEMLRVVDFLVAKERAARGAQR